MRYSLIDIETGVDYGMDPKIHRTTSDGRMVVNENELADYAESPEEGARQLGGTLMSEQEIFNILNKISHG